MSTHSSVIEIVLCCALILLLSSGWTCPRLGSICIVLKAGLNIINMEYTRNELLSIKENMTLSQNKVDWRTLHEIRDMNIARVFRTKRGTAAGRMNLNATGKQKGVTVKNIVSVPIMGSKNDKPLSMCVLNCQSARNKACLIVDYIRDNDFDVIALTETWFKAGDGDQKAKGDVTPSGYTLRCLSRTRKRGGGVAWLFKETLSISENVSLSTDSYEALGVNVTHDNTTIRMIVLYRPPRTPRGSDFFNDFADMIDEYAIVSGKLVIVGDYNYHWDRANDPNTRRLKDLLDTANMMQCVNEPTHREGHTIDLVITRSCDDIVGNTSVHSMISDHMAVHIELNVTKPPRPTKTISYRKLRAVDHDNVHMDIEQSPLLLDPETVSVDSMVRQYQTSLGDILDTHAPVKTKTFVVRTMVPWYTEDIEDAKRCLRRLERLWRRTRLTVHRQMYQTQRLNLKLLIQGEKARYFGNKISQCAGNQRVLFKTVTELLHRKGSQSRPNGSAQEVAERFSKFFETKIENIRALLNADHDPDEDQIADQGPRPPVIFDTFSIVTDDDIRKIIAKSSDATCALDPLPTTFIKRHVDILLPVITKIVNASLQSGIFPTQLKQARVKPLLKKTSLDPEVLKHYRPVSNIPYLSKLIEKVVVSQIMEHMVSGNLHESFQSAYKTCNSTETALLRVQNDIRMAIDQKHCVMLVLLDLSAAFDTVDHTLLISRMINRLGIDGTVIRWFESYLSARSQTISIGEACSIAAMLLFGVPQGSVLGPILFLIYTLPIGDIARKHGLHVHLYADDTQLYVSFKPADQLSARLMLHKVETCIAVLRHWMVQNKLKLNDEKTEVIVLTSKQHRSSHGISQVFVGDVPIEPKQAVRNLGAIFDQSLTMDDFVKAICSSAYFHLRNLSSIRSSITQESAHTLVHAFISSRLDYCNSLLVGISVASLNKLQRVQNMAARLVTKTKKRDHITPVLKSLHWLPVKERITFKVLLLAFKCIHHKAPKYLSDLLHIYEPPRQLRSSNSSLLTVPKSRLKTVGDRTFVHNAATLWNALPEHLRAIDSLTKFKSSLKTYLYQQTYLL